MSSAGTSPRWTWSSAASTRSPRMGTWWPHQRRAASSPPTPSAPTRSSGWSEPKRSCPIWTPRSTAPNATATAGRRPCPRRLRQAQLHRQTTRRQPRPARPPQRPARRAAPRLLAQTVLFKLARPSSWPGAIDRQPFTLRAGVQQWAGWHGPRSVPRLICAGWLLTGKMDRWTRIGCGWRSSCGRPCRRAPWRYLSR